ncbi:MAG: enoyl-CoA hydratase-related protein [Pseudomonadota bacterium]
MASEVHYSVENGVAVLCMTRGTENVLVPDMRAELIAAVGRAIVDDAVTGVVLTGLGRGFSSGIDIEEYNQELSSPWMTDLCQTIEDAPKPIVAALHGSALGAGFELALAAHARVAKTGTMVALPEVRLGLLPGGGGTQRLPRLAGAQASLKMILSGQVYPVEDPMLTPVFARILPDDPMPAAIQLVRQLAQAGIWPKTSESMHGFSDPTGYQRAIQSVRSKLTENDRLEADVLRCVEAAQLLPFDQAMQLERTLFEARRTSSKSRGIRHAFAAERRARAMPDLTGTIPKDVEKVVVVGTAPTQADLVVAALNRGKTVSILTSEPVAAEQIAARVRDIYQTAVERGRIDIIDRDARLRELSAGDDRSVIPQADLILDGGGVVIAHTKAKPDAAWCVLDEALPSAERALQVGHPTMALRIYRPAYIPRLAEIATNADSPADAVARAVSYFSTQGATVLRATERPGLLGHRLMAALQRAALVLVRSGADLFAVDEAAEALGFVRGPFRSMETDRLEQTSQRIRRIIGPETNAPELGLLEARAVLMASGTAAGTGFYAAHDDKIVPDPAVRGWLDTWRAGQTDLKTDLSRIEGPSLQLALHAAIVNKAVSMIEAGDVVRASDIDLCMVKGYGFDRTRGGPLLWADIQGLLPLLRTMKALAPLSDVWHPHPKIVDMVKNGERFFS